MIEPQYIKQALEFYKTVKNGIGTQIDQNLPKLIKSQAQTSFPSQISEYETIDSINKIENILKTFVIKRPDIGYHIGFHHICAMIFTVYNSEIDAFIVFGFIIEKIFPDV